jgi:hypothetical protein
MSIHQLLVWIQHIPSAVNKRQTFPAIETQASLVLFDKSLINLSSFLKVEIFLTGNHDLI